MSSKLERITPVLDAVEKAGGIRIPLINELSNKEKRKVTFSVWGFLFTIFYYVYQGMWKKGLVLLVVCVALQIISAFTIELIFPAFTNAAWVISSAVYATRAPVNLYSKYRLNDDSWNPLR